MSTKDQELIDFVEKEIVKLEKIKKTINEYERVCSINKEIWLKKQVIRSIQDKYAA